MLDRTNSANLLRAETGNAPRADQDRQEPGPGKASSNMSQNRRLAANVEGKKTGFSELSSGMPLRFIASL